MSKDFKFRVANIKDADEIARLINLAFQAEFFIFGKDRIDPPGVRELFGKGTFVVTEHSAGFAGCVYVERRGEAGYLGLLSVDPALQGTGLGSRLMAEAEQQARAMGCVALDLRIVSPRSQPLLPFYKRLGYVERGTAQMADDVTTNVPCHYILMSKSL